MIKTKGQVLSGAAAIALAAATLMPANPALACAAEPLIGTVCYMAAQYCPNGYLPANGQLLPIQQYQAVYALFGTTYGGDGRTTFGLPDLRGRSPVGVTTAINSGGTPITAVGYGQMRGAETSILQTTNLPPAGGAGGPAQVLATTNAASTNAPSNTVQLATVPSASTSGGDTVDVKMYAPIGGTQVPLGGVSGGGGSASGNSTPFTNLPPQVGLTACVAVNGIWPSRPD